MTDSPSQSREKSSPATKLTYEHLLLDLDKWDKLWGLFHSSQWEALGDLMEAERQYHLDLVVRGAGPQSNEGAFMAEHLAIARWITDFSDKATGIRAQLESRKDDTVPRTGNGEEDPSAYMALDSEQRAALERAEEPSS